MALNATRKKAGRINLIVLKVKISTAAVEGRKRRPYRLNGHLRPLGGYISHCSISIFRDSSLHCQCDAPRYGLQRRGAPIDKEYPRFRLIRGWRGWGGSHPEAYLALIVHPVSSGRAPEQPIGAAVKRTRTPCLWQRSMPVRSVGVGLIRSVASRLGC